MKPGKHYHETQVARLLKQARQHERASILRDLGTRADVTRLREVAAFLDGYQAAFVASAGRTHEALVWRDDVRELVKLLERMEVLREQGK